MKTTDSLVLFWRTAEVYSNWHPARLVAGNVLSLENSEQFMMWAKAWLMGDAEMALAMMFESDPKKLKAMGREVQNYQNDVWVKNRLAVMVYGCYLKFSQNEVRKTTLLATGERIIVEASPDDRIWGIGLEESDPRCLDKAQWEGFNLLGEALMIVRALLRDDLPLPLEYTTWLLAA